MNYIDDNLKPIDENNDYIIKYCSDTRIISREYLIIWYNVIIVGDNMDDKKIMKIIDTDGKEHEYEILFAFKWTKTNKNYIVYTDNTNNANGSLNVFAAIYYPNDDTKLDSIETDMEWDEIERRLRLMQQGSDTDE